MFRMGDKYLRSLIHLSSPCMAILKKAIITARIAIIGANVEKLEHHALPVELYNGTSKPLCKL